MSLQLYLQTPDKLVVVYFIGLLKSVFDWMLLLTRITNQNAYRQCVHTTGMYKIKEDNQNIFFYLSV